ncbi:threonine--tRNA ligase [Patescibacteria group bacterium]|nr:threonine--tRNA ligase [Patescibacteria group bacterium]
MAKKISLEILRHSTSHLMAAAVLELFPKAKFGIGPVIANGFYYDFDLGRNLTPQDLAKIEMRMKQLAKKNVRFVKKQMTIDQAIELFKKLKQPYKIELLRDIKKAGTTKIKKSPGTQVPKHPSTQVTIYTLGNFVDLCRGPHIKSTKELDVYKLTKIAGAYWRGDEKNKMLQRIYGLAFENKKELDEFLKLQIEAEKRDHRKLGQELDLFSIDEEVGAGLPLWHPKGAILRQIIEDFWLKEHFKNGYQIVRTPHIGNLNLWKTSGHWDFYREDMYSPIDIEGQKYLIKPMNCPFHIKIYQTKNRSYRDLPFRWAELGAVYRFERSGVLHGLVRVRGFTQDDAHTFCTPEQLDKEIETTVKFAIKILKTFGFKDYDVCLSTRPKKFVGTIKSWEKATKALEYSLKKLKIKYQIDPGEGVFYGPKIDIKIKDSLGRAWQCTTVQLDFNMPERFKMTYIDNKGKKRQPIMIHRALLGSLERFIGVLIEHYAGAFPVWLSPVQVYLTPVGKTHRKVAQKIAQELESYEIRTEVDILNETIPYKVRKAEKQKIPYILVIGDKEAKGKNLNVRMRGNIVKRMTKKQFLDKILKEVKKKK